MLPAHPSPDLPAPRVSRRGRVVDAVVAGVLFVAALAVLVRTDQMGFARDEAFYFGHAEGYQDWQVEVEAGGERRRQALSRDGLLQAWRANSEHPPLNKWLFGWSWRAFGRKLREAGGWRRQDGAIVGDLRGLGAAHGFQPGAKVTILAPQLVDGPRDVAGRALAHGEIIERSTFSATVRLVAAAGAGPADAATAGAGTTEAPAADADPQIAALQRRCGQPGTRDAAGALLRTGCEAVEDRVGLVLSESAAMRLPGMAFGALLVALLWAMARGLPGGRPLLERPFALVVAIGYLAIPRPFHHAHLAAFDTTITCLVFATTLAYHRSLRARAWVWITAILWGVGLLAKHNALFLPVALIGHWLWDAWAEGRLGLVRAAPVGAAPPRWRLPPWGWAAVTAVALAAIGAWLGPVAGLAAALLTIAGAGPRLHLPPLPTAWFAMLPIGLAILFAGWPLLWVDGAEHLLGWIEFHLHHEHYMQHYFGKVLAYPPFPVELPFALTALTWPPALLLAAIVGLALWSAASAARATAAARAIASRWPWRDPLGLPARARREATAAARLRSFDRLMVLTALWPLVLIALPSTPVFGGTKHWFTAYPALLYFAARGAQWLWRAAMHAAADRAPAAWLARGGAWALALALLVPAIAETAASHPHGTAHYNAWIGGVGGAVDAGLQRQFWGAQSRYGLDAVNALAPRFGRVWFHKTAWGAVRMYEREGMLRRDLSFAADPAQSELGLFHHQYDHDDYELDLFEAYGTRVPVGRVAHEGVPMLTIYKRPGSAGPPPAPPSGPASASPAVAP